MNTAVFRYLRGDRQDAFRLFKEILDVDADHMQAVFNLALMYQNGEGVKQDEAKAFELYERAHRAGHEGSTCNLGMMYMKGVGVRQNKEKGFELLQQAHTAGHADATFNVAASYDNGDGVKQDKAKTYVFSNSKLERILF